MSSIPKFDNAASASLKWLFVSGIIVALDQYTKWLIINNFYEFERALLLPMLDLVRYHNKGAAFSLFANAGGWQTWFFTGVAVIISIAIVWYQWSLPKRGCRTLATGLALILGGAVGNVIDRLLHGHVVDFILFYYEEWAWPAFNVADSAITVGVALVIIDSLFFERNRELGNKS
jgi:signal peptidase II